MEFRIEHKTRIRRPRKRKKDYRIKYFFLLGLMIIANFAWDTYNRNESFRVFCDKQVENISKTYLEIKQKTEKEIKETVWHRTSH